MRKNSRKELEQKALEAAEVVKSAILRHETAHEPAQRPAKTATFLDCVPGSKVPRVLAIGFVPLPARVVIDRLFVGGERRREWNPGWERTRVIDAWRHAGRDFSLYHEEVRGALGGMISGRDFVQVRVSWHDDSGRSWVVWKSVDDARAPTPDAKHQRATSFASGSMAMDLDDGKSCVLHSLVHTSPGGSIPAWIVAKGVTSELLSFFSSAAHIFGGQK